MAGSASIGGGEPCGLGSRNAPEDEGVGEGVAAQSLASVHAARGFACGEEPRDGLFISVEDLRLRIDENPADRDVHAQALDAVVEGRRVDRLQEGLAAEAGILSFCRVRVVGVHREGEALDRDARVVGKRGEGLRLPDDARGEL